MRRIIAIILLAGALTACRDDNGPPRVIGTEADGDVATVLREHEGHEYICFVYDGYKAGGIWCERVPS